MIQRKHDLDKASEIIKSVAPPPKPTSLPKPPASIINIGMLKNCQPCEDEDLVDYDELDTEKTYNECKFTNMVK